MAKEIKIIIWEKDFFVHQRIVSAIKRPLGRPRRKWENIKMDLQEVGWGPWNGLSWLRIETGGRLL
jgi:hypothetical protein